MSNVFRFKEFDVRQSENVFKVGTDSILFGAWVESHEPKTILDIGTGTGLLTLMMAQKYEGARITGVDINESAIELAKENAANSKWKSRIDLKKLDVNDLSGKFDLILSNPPYFGSGIKPVNSNLELARHQTALTLDGLFRVASNCLLEGGTFQLIHPFTSLDEAMSLCENHGLHLNRVTWVRGEASKPVKRAMASFSKELSKPIEKSISIYTGGQTYSTEFIGLTKNFYLNF